MVAAGELFFVFVGGGLFFGVSYHNNCDNHSDAPMEISLPIYILQTYHPYILCFFLPNISWEATHTWCGYLNGSFFYH